MFTTANNIPKQQQMQTEKKNNNNEDKRENILSNFSDVYHFLCKSIYCNALYKTNPVEGFFPLASFCFFSILGCFYHFFSELLLLFWMGSVQIVSPRWTRRQSSILLLQRQTDRQTKREEVEKHFLSNVEKTLKFVFKCILPWWHVHSWQRWNVGNNPTVAMWRARYAIELVIHYFSYDFMLS